MYHPVAVSAEKPHVFQLRFAFLYSIKRYAVMCLEHCFAEMGRMI